MLAKCDVVFSTIPRNTETTKTRIVYSRRLDDKLKFYDLRANVNYDYLL